MEQNNTKQLFVIAAKLLVICTIVAVIIAFVNAITKDRIELNELNSTAEALSGVYGADYNYHTFEVVKNDGEKASFVMKDDSGNAVVTCEAAECETLPTISGVYVIKDSSGEPVNYCIFAAPMGFKAEINMLVAVNPTLTVKAVKIISMSDTSGIGTKVQEEGFLSQFADKNSVIGNVDTISGATKTSKPVINAVDTALKQAAQYIAEQGGVE